MTAARAALDVGALAEHVGRRREMFYPKADIAIDDAMLRQLSIHAADERAEDARKALDTALGSQAKDFTLAPLLQQGTYHRVYAASDASGHRRYVVRLNRLPEAETDWQLFADESVSKALSEAGIAHPAVLLVDCSRRAAATDFEVSEYVEGESLSVHDADDAAIAPWLANAARTLAKVHAIRGERFGFIDISRAPTLAGVHLSWPAYLRVQLAENLEHVRREGLLDQEELAAAQRHFDAGLKTLGSIEPRLLHGDTGNHNILARGDLARGSGEVVFIDWEDALLGDPLFDLAFWATFHPERRWPAFFEAYFGHAWQPDARFWLYYLRVAISKTVHRLRFGYTDRPDRPKASLRMQRALQALATTGSPA